MAELDTNFVDAVLSANMNGKKRVRLTQIAENEYIVEDITEYEKVGSEYGQKEINTLNETVNGKVNKVEVIDDLDTVKAVTEDNVPVGCKAVTKLANDVNQSLTNLKNPAKGTKGILVNGGSPLSRDFLLCYTLQSTNTAYSGAYISINGITVAQLTSQSANCKQTIVGSVRAFKGDIISITISNFGGDASVYAYC